METQLLNSKLSVFIFVIAFFVSHPFASSTSSNLMEMVVPSNGFPSWLTDFDPAKTLRIHADLIVSKDGTGDYKTINEAVAAAPTRDATIITGSLNFKDGTKTFDSATVAIDGNWFMAQDLWIQNTAGPAKGQAVALRVSDFIFGHASAVFQNCRIEARKPMEGQSNVITAQQNDKSGTSGFSIQNCSITASSDLVPVKRMVKTFLGRPWGDFSTVVFMESYLDDMIDPMGWTSWNSSTTGRLSTLYYGEYKNKGPGANTSQRVRWKGFKIITDPIEANKFTVGKLINKDPWLNATGIPYNEGL
ncbi:Pectin lyase fold/virulence factor [Arabidopsis thaliana x Arabidopsis arenosa]|nr:Pectin lyase fold/virulence factor [Arabidopsis thaliana x Arabidopsis arenosa]